MERAYQSSGNKKSYRMLKESAVECLEKTVTNAFHHKVFR